MFKPDPGPLDALVNFIKCKLFTPSPKEKAAEFFENDKSSKIERAVDENTMLCNFKLSDKDVKPLCNFYMTKEGILCASCNKCYKV
jgi:hypothetical protein